MSFIDYQKISVDEALGDLRIGMYRLKGKLPSKFLNTPLVPLSPISILIAETFYMNNYEVNTILTKFIEMWSKNVGEPYIRVSSFISTFKLFNCGFINIFFPEGRVYVNQFFQFVCIMSLFEFHQIIPLMVSACKIHSNLLITKQQIQKLTHIFDKENRADLTPFYKENEVDIPDSKEVTYSLKKFLEFVNKNIIYQSNFFQIQMVIGKEIFSTKYVNNIRNRYNYFIISRRAAVDESYIYKHIPKESCMSQFVRLITNEPPPYYYDYSVNERIEFMSSDNYVDTLVLLMKQAHGYGYRSSKAKMNKTNKSESSFNHSLSSNFTSSNNNSTCNTNNASAGSIMFKSKIREYNMKPKGYKRSKSFFISTVRSLQTRCNSLGTFDEKNSSVK